MKNLAKAVIAVMSEIKGIEKTKDVGEGRYSFKGVEDRLVKQIIGGAMERHGLCLLPIDVQDEVINERWDDGGRQKTSVFTKVKTKYLLLHESGESVELTGYGHGTDSQDKSAGKATTYALKYTLLYTFLVPTGKIDDADDTDPTPTSRPKPQPLAAPAPAPKAKPALTPSHPKWMDAVNAVASGSYTVDVVKQKYTLEGANDVLFENAVQVAQKGPKK
jgi:hypothetical protein